MVEVGSVRTTVGGDSLVEQPHLGLGLHLAGLHHDRHGVRLLGDQTEEGGLVLVMVVLLVTLVSPLHRGQDLRAGVSDGVVDRDIEIILAVLGVHGVIRADQLRVVHREV